MSTDLRSLRVAGISVADVSDWREPLPFGKWSQFFGAIAKRVTVVDTIRPVLGRHVDALNMIKSFYPSKDRWFAQAGFSLSYADKLTAGIEEELQRRDGSYDLLVQLQTLCAPGARQQQRPYVIYTDNTFALTQRLFRQWAPLPESRVHQWGDFESRISRSAQVVYTFSEFARQSMLEDYGCDPERVVAIGAGANQMIESVDGKDYSRPVALFVGRPFAPKGGLTLLEAWADVRGRVPDAKLIIAGPRERPPRTLPAGVEWEGRVDRMRLAQLYQRATVFVLPTNFDAWGHVFVEAMGHGLPCIGTNLCAMPEIIEHDLTGLLVPRGDVDAVGEALVGLLGDPSRAAAMGRRAHARVRSELTWSHVADRFVARLPDPAALLA